MDSLNIIIVDDDNGRSQMLRLMLQRFLSTRCENVDFKEFFEDYSVTDIKVEGSLESLVDVVLSANPTCLLIDYMLSSRSNVSFTGVDLANSIEEKAFDIPAFILTSYEDELFRDTDYDPQKVYDISQLSSDASNSGNEDELARKDEGLEKRVLKKSLLYRKLLLAEEAEFSALSAKERRTADEDSRLLELDSYIERRTDGHGGLSEKAKRDITSNKIDELIAEICEIAGGSEWLAR